MKMPLTERLKCEYSYVDDSADLKCELRKKKCDGVLFDCCLLGKSIFQQEIMIREYGEKE